LFTSFIVSLLWPTIFSWLRLLIVMANILHQHPHYIYITLKASMEKVMNLKTVRTLHVSNLHLHHHFKYPKRDQLSLFMY
jgi:hypothetical protein